MHRSRAHRLCLAAAIGAVLATAPAGGQAVAVSASASASATVTAEAGRQAVVPYPAGRSRLASVGSTGFLTWTEGTTGTWTASAGDLVARDRDGVLWLYLGRGNGTLAPRTRIGGGWNAYGQLVGFGDGDFDGRPDLYATAANSGQDAFFYSSTGNWRRPFDSRAGITLFFYQTRTYDLLA